MVSSIQWAAHCPPIFSFSVRIALRGEQEEEREVELLRKRVGILCQRNEISEIGEDNTRGGETMRPSQEGQRPLCIFYLSILIQGEREEEDEAKSPERPNRPRRKGKLSI